VRKNAHELDSSLTVTSRNGPSCSRASSAAD
jgi:hypothetical protein